MINGDDPRPRWIVRLIAELSALLQEEIELAEPLENCLMGDEAFSCLIRSSPPQGNGFQLCWEGVLGMQLIDGEPDTSVSLFLYSRNRRLGVMDDRDGSFLEVVYEGSLEHGGQWGNPVWMRDDLGEYRAYESYGDR
ncbi:hypothetical protein BZB76_5202 [Actinomadura pelletieri DSM 43383]|uniref:Uncharacterized protein n=1 Tax=Actinomadura pelletieri DSM 43383 TaxID=1120940 RepID=A0A495QG33_9ACTN|nr:hypothetical protein [Actinomadura pelletieri]RKS70723.1 hypothetical protein BZB76_5202 [Actinomadura pelletieri DSM 43383]